MDDDPHALWRVVGRNYESAARNAPEGYEAIVELYLDTWPIPIPVAVVETRRGFPWAMVHSLTEGKADSERAYPNDRYLFIEREKIARVEIRYVAEAQPPRRKLPFGFRHVETDDSAS